MNSSKEANGSASGNIQSVDATSLGLIKSTIGAALVAGAILIFAWLPAEYGIDPTGVGRILGLTEMGEIKEQLHAEADADIAADSATNEKLEGIQAQLTAIAMAVGAEQPVPATQKTTSLNATSNENGGITWLHENSYTLTPDEGFEVKLVMDEGAIAEYEWTANGAVLNHDTHGDGKDGQELSYEQGRSVPEKSGTLTAAFTGNHGWFWRNRTDGDVVVTLRTRGDYKDIVLP